MLKRVLVVMLAASTTAAAWGETDVQKLADRQGTNHINTVVAQRKAEAMGKQPAVVVEIDRAASNMSDAAAALVAAQREAATPPATAAIRNLDNAIRLLERQMTDIDTAALERAREELLKQYRALRDQQATINECTAAAVGKTDDRRTLLKLAKLVTEQAAAVETAQKLGDHPLLNTRAVRAIHDDMTTQMGRSRAGLASATLSNRVARAQAAALARIDDMITMLENKPDATKRPDFATPPGDSGPTTPPDHVDEVPTLVSKLAELKLLRALQANINTDTKAVDAELAGKPAGRSALVQDLRDLAEQQAQVEALSREVLLPRR